MIYKILGCRFFYASSACIYPEFKQLETNVSLKESDAWPAEPQDAYGLEKLASEELCKHYTKDLGIECRIGRFHNIYGPFGTWKGFGYEFVTNRDER
ncbi:GDP-mannose 3,5-epimerase 1-like [Dendrobium catenatum]|uniref:GDP-mannose 3,5-epimerase 1-like n=1 Tax=Dendrobium catenatum TaxID=906689 RepID=UPI00109F9DE3|nr:GDP-mannose 3,5-epimerase 1-like [Dendrobium catenatum]